MGAGGHLRWVEHPELRAMMDSSSERVCLAGAATLYMVGEICARVTEIVY